MPRYFTPHALVKAYRPEAESATVIALLKQTSPPLRLSHLHRLELERALRSDPTAQKHWREDQAAGLYEFVEASVGGLVNRSLELATDLSGQLDSATSLHLATALELGCTEWVGFDAASRNAATAAGLKVLPTTLDLPS